ncbi:MAG: 50S ribosomal protein L29 [Actinomycetota bacterium]
MTRAAELRELPEAELRSRLDSAKEELFNLRFQLATGQLDNVMRIKEVRHEAARILTILHERELVEGAEAAAETDAESGDQEEAS